MDNKEAQTKLNKFGVGQLVNLTGYFDFPNKQTEREEKIVEINADSVVIERPTASSPETLQYSAITFIM
ncbi:hypothetical protein AOA59_18480 [Pseudomonas sp. 2822-15]|uniref:Uncharacterized protein n=1 Tax=Pseudomonas salomonii TaxID=191391 RepID=A0A1H3SHP4_9PSED|nr:MULTISPECIES: hypothetical protein [Pseudomonas]PIB43052.1 hypothetical protein AOA59_18480 [Pseudomonas sp. 2822-15]CRM39785.1 hypothetical protein [Pseudomonas sp. 58 R 3]SDZ37218.1 hypothetical protein SAMN05216247_109181 [Pseudomonas salomonii]